MQGVTTKSMLRLLGVGALVLGLAGPALAQLPPGPPNEVPPWLAAVLDRLDDIETKIDNQSTDLRGVTQNWDKKLDSTNGSTAVGREGCNSDRFKCIFPTAEEAFGEAVRDEQTGLVWDRSPHNTRGGTDPGESGLDWEDAREHCANRVMGGQFGQRLPSIAELASLLDPNNPGGDPDLPPGHPFIAIGVGTGFYWSATANAVNPTNSAWNVHFTDSEMFTNGIGSTLRVWCVRGGHNDGSQY